MKKVFVIILSVIVCLVLIYFVIFTIYFSVGSLAKKIEHIVNVLTTRNVIVSKASLSPFGNFKMKNFKLSNKAGFKHGIFISIDDISAKLSMLELLKVELILKDAHLDRLEVNLNYENKRRFNHLELLDDIKKNFAARYSTSGFIRKMEIHSIVIENSAVNLKLDLGNVKFYDVVLQSRLFDYYNNYFAGNVFFKVKIGALQSDGSFEFNYDKGAKILHITDFICNDLSLSADGNIKFLDDGKTQLEYTAKIKKEKLRSLTFDLTGYSLYSADNVNNVEDIIISYPDIEEKEIKTVI